MSEEANDEAKKENDDGASFFASFSSFVLGIARFAVEVNIMMMSYKLCGNSILGVILSFLLIMFGKSAYISTKIPDVYILATIDEKEYAAKLTEIAPGIVVILLAVMVALRVVVISST